MPLSKEQLESLAFLARLDLSEKEKGTFGPQMDNILEYVKELEELDTKNTLPTSQVTGLHNCFREDEVKKYPHPEKLLTLAPESQEGCFVIPRVIE